MERMDGSALYTAPSSRRWALVRPPPPSPLPLTRISFEESRGLARRRLQRETE